ncbi:hypothetical protein BDZ45DRAFT_748369 [Acephala macrosclerotiorum]|nr:hypothetical protein BDZ45DRAFT_748369 [Acephala macrosclerotiorum]
MDTTNVAPSEVSNPTVLDLFKSQRYGFRHKFPTMFVNQESRKITQAFPDNRILAQPDFAFRIKNAQNIFPPSHPMPDWGRPSTAADPGRIGSLRGLMVTLRRWNFDSCKPESSAEPLQKQKRGIYRVARGPGCEDIECITTGLAGL